MALSCTTTRKNYKLVLHLFGQVSTSSETTFRKEKDMTNNPTNAQKSRPSMRDWLTITKLVLSHGFGQLFGRKTYKSFTVSGSPAAFERSYESILAAYQHFLKSRHTSQSFELNEPNAEDLPYTALPALTRLPGSVSKTFVLSGSLQAFKSNRRISMETFDDFLNSTNSGQLYFLD